MYHVRSNKLQLLFDTLHVAYLINSHHDSLKVFGAPSDMQFSDRQESQSAKPSGVFDRGRLLPPHTQSYFYKYIVHHG
jgi:hypothetical protein